MSASDKTKLNATADYVTAQGTSGAWRYQKYSNGLAICYGTFSLTTAISTADGVLYCSSTLASQSLPFTFAATPLFIPGRVSGAANGAWITGFDIGAQGSTTATPAMAMLRGATLTTSGTYTIGWFVIGRWK